VCSIVKLVKLLTTSDAVASGRKLTIEAFGGGKSVLVDNFGGVQIAILGMSLSFVSMRFFFVCSIHRCILRIGATYNCPN
jgi:hypothetical protein